MASPLNDGRPVDPDGVSGAGTGSSAAGPSTRGARRSGPARTATIVVLLVALAEVVAVIAVGSWVGPLATILFLVSLSALGVVVIAHQGTKSLTAMREAARTGVMPAQELADASVVTVAGLLLFVPGFLTAAVGLVMLLPFTRPLSRRLLSRSLGRRVMVVGPDGRVAGVAEVVDGEVVDGVVVDETTTSSGQARPQVTREVIDIGRVDVTVVRPEDERP